MVILFWILWVVLCGIVASNKNRSVANWVVLGILFGIFAFIPLLFLNKIEKE
jgi:hypothetical protein